MKLSEILFSSSVFNFQNLKLSEYIGNYSQLGQGRQGRANVNIEIHCVDKAAWRSYMSFKFRLMLKCYTYLNYGFLNFLLHFNHSFDQNSQFIYFSQALQVLGSTCVKM